MPNAKPLETIQKELQDMLVDDIATALKTLQELLSSQTDTYATVIGLLARLNDANKERLRGTLSNDELNIEYNNIRAAFLEVVQDLKAEDLKSASDAKQDATGEAAPRQGSILYRIPGKMPKDKESKCVVRIALSEDAIVEDITIDEHVHMKELYRVSDTMQTELLDPSGGEKFKINTISDDVQMIDEEGFTEWWFYVTPLVEGTHPLILKVSIIETVDDEVRSKELVMEESVEVVAEGPVVEPEAAKPKQAGILNFQSTATAGAGLITGAKKSKSAKSTRASRAAQASKTTATTTKSVVAKLGLLQKVAVGLAVVGTTAVATWVLTPESTRDWWTTRYVEDTVVGYTAYMNEHPTSRYYEPAACRKAILLDSPEAYRDYLIEFPDGACDSMAAEALVRLEKEALEAIEKTPTRENLDAFMINFPACENLEALYTIVEKKENLREEYLPFILQRWEECKRQDPAFPEPPNIISTNLPSLAPVEPPASPAPVPPKAPATNTTAVPTQTPRPSTPAPPATIPPPEPKMVFVQGGSFEMGLENDQGDNMEHAVTLRDFFIGQFEVTFEEYDRFCTATGREQPEDKGWGRNQRPVIGVSWFDAVHYCNWLSKATGRKEAYTISGSTVQLKQNSNGYRLPTEAEWEYAASGGPLGRKYRYSGSDAVNEVGWYLENSDHQTHPVGHLKPNGLSIHDMSGNVREWCYDWHTPFTAQAETNPTGPATGVKRVFRGGFWGRNPNQMEVSYRNSWNPSFKHYGTGFRLARWK